MKEQRERSFGYCIDADDRLTFVASEWLDLAKENAAANLSHEAVCGQPLFTFISDPETQHLYKILIDKVRQSQDSMVVPFRYDSPSLRRFMELHISPLPDGAVQFEGRLVREEPREKVPLLDPSVERSDEIIVACSWCKRIDADEVWLDGAVQPGRPTADLARDVLRLLRELPTGAASIIRYGETAGHRRIRIRRGGRLS